ncbi:MAG: Dabb family protein, partial [Oscillospiraceae bacterium]|nr:Dabb family protein [Oscillospiraceae bacterium]
ILQVVLDDAAALDAYQQDAYHCDVVKKHMHAVAEQSIALDYEI